MNDYDEIEANIEANDDNGVTGQIDTSNPFSAMDGAPAGCEWTHTPKTEKGEPYFETVDNPGNWSPYTYKAKFPGGLGLYKDHRMPAGATVVPKDPETGK